MKNILDFSDFSSINEDLSEYTPKLISLINTKKFKDWFGDWTSKYGEHSLVVDDDGYPLIMYHGSNVKNINKFEMNDGAMGKGVYFTSSFAEACDYVRDKFGVGDLSEDDEEYMDEDACYEYVGCYFLNVRDEDRICYSKYGWSKWVLVTDNSEIMKIDLD